MEHSFMDALQIVEENLVRKGISKEEAKGLIKKLIWILVCRL
ncbi:hypothetical protein [Alkalibacter rhizosphaerae]|nr:hypothetical protein [Alkalibacter rhizosphaerae]